MINAELTMLNANNNACLRRNPRLWIVCFTAISASMPIGFISVSKLFLYVFGMFFLIAQGFNEKSSLAISKMWTSRVILTCLMVFFASLLWSPVSISVAASTLVKHGKILTVLLLIGLISSEKEARTALVAFALGQTFLLATSWSMVFGIHPLWAFELDGNGDPRGPYVVFSSYLDQSILFASAAGIFFHLRSEKIWSQIDGLVLSILGILSVLFLLPGRTGYLIVLAGISLAAMWALPRRLRVISLVIVPIFAALILTIGSSKIRDRVTKIIDEGKGFATQTQTESSSGWRLNAWHRSIQAIAEKPWIGHGAGSWLVTVKRFQGESASAVFGDSDSSNPHQEFLLWGVEVGIGGTLLLVTLLGCIVVDARKFNVPIARANITLATSMAIACFFNSALYDGLVGDFLFVALGLLMALGIWSKSKPQEETDLSKDSSLAV